MKIFGIVVLSLLLVIIGFVLYGRYKINNVKDNHDLAASIQRTALDYIEKGNSIGMVVGVIKDDQIYIQGFGHTQKGSAEIPDSSTIFELASTSKLFTTSVLQIMADQGELKIDDKIQSLLGNKLSLPAAAQNTTLQHLATHLSGFPSLPASFLDKMTDETNPYKSLVVQDIYDYLANCKDKQPDGTFEYSNFGMGLLGHLLAEKKKMDYEVLVKQLLLQPLQMNHTFVTIDSSMRPLIAQGYDEEGNAAPIWEDHVLTGAGSFLSNGADMMRFIQANLKSEASSVSPALLRTHEQQLKGDTGLGWILPSSAEKLMGLKNIVWHNGMAGGYASFIGIDRNQQIGVFVLSNKAIDVSSFGLKMMLKVKTQSWKAG